MLYAPNLLALGLLGIIFACVLTLSMPATKIERDEVMPGVTCPTCPTCPTCHERGIETFVVLLNDI